MSSGSRETIVGLVVAAASWTFVATLLPGSLRAGSDTVHLAVPPPAEEDAAFPPPSPDTLRVCADPNNLPFSSRDGRGFENEIASVVAGELHRTVRYFWMPQRRGFVRTTLNAGRCDVIMGVPVSLERVRVTRPYYRSAFMFVARRDRGLRVRSLDDARLRGVRIGIQMTGDDYDNPPAAAALAARHITDNVRGYTVYGNYAAPNPAWGVLEAVAARQVDVAIVWGPLAGYFARVSQIPVALDPVRPEIDTVSRPFAFDIGMAVRRGDDRLAGELDAAVARRAADIRGVLTRYGVPVLPPRAERQEG